MIKKIGLYIISCLLLIVGLCLSNTSEAYRYTPYQGNNGIDVQNYKIEIGDINRSTQEINFTTTITAKANRDFLAGERFGLDFIDSYSISEIVFNSESINAGDYKITYTGSVALSGTNKRLEIKVPSNVNTSGDIIIKVTYSGIPKLDMDTSGLGFYTTGTELHAFNQPLGAHQRFPCSDVPSDKATLDMYVTTLTSKVVVGNGKLMYDTDNGNGTHTVYRKEKYPISTYNMYVGVGPFSYMYSGTSPFLSGIQNIQGYSKVSNSILSNKIKDLSTSTGMMKQMIDIFGPYPFADEKFGIILRPINNYMEHNTIVGMSSVGSDSMIRHELTHQWLGNLVTIASWQDIWIAEAAGVYFPQVSKVGKNNRAEATYGLSKTMNRTRAVNNPLDTDLFNNNLVYTRAAWIYHHLRSYLGDDLYFSGLNYYINKYAHGTVSTQEFKQTREESSNINLSGFFNRFVYGTGTPILKVSNFYDNINDGTYSGRALFKLSRSDNKARTPDVVFAKINYTDGSSGEFRIFQENEDSYVQINTPKNISGIVIDPGSGTVNRQTDYIGTLYNSGFSIQDDSDSDLLPDGREYIIFGDLNQTATGDYNSNGISNIDEYNLISDTTPPVGTITYSTLATTSGSVTATISLDETGTITNNSGSATYIFTGNGSFTFEFTDIAGNKGSATATVNNIVTVSNSNGGGGGSSVSKDYCPAGDNSSSYYDHSCGVDTSTTEKDQNTRISEEITRAYVWAYSKGITTMKTLGLARVQDTTTRAEMAKMIVSYAIKELKKIPNTGLNCIFTDIDSQNTELQGYIKLACQLHIMGLNADGTPNSTFNPTDEVTRAEFGTTLSRVLYGNRNNYIGPNTQRYDKHLQVLNQEGIINDISKPYAKEIRGYIMLMLQRTENLIGRQ